MEYLGEINNKTRKFYRGRLGIAEGKITGFSTTVNDMWKRFRIDFDPNKGPHINIEIGKNSEGKRKAIQFPGTEKDVKKIIKGFNKN